MGREGVDGKKRAGTGRGATFQARGAEYQRQPLGRGVMVGRRVGLIGITLYWEGYGGGLETRRGV